MPFLFALLSKNFLVSGGCAQYCKARRIIVVMAAVETVSVLATILAAAPPIMESGDWAWRWRDREAVVRIAERVRILSYREHDVMVLHTHLRLEWCLFTDAKAATWEWCPNSVGAIIWSKKKGYIQWVAAKMEIYVLLFSDSVLIYAVVIECW